ncbi:hypothetical protein LRS05_02665 [Flavobacterium sp. J372]|uniref:HmuY family protein n=1 Tax=Flavobacterium sp. J372 TaxID=2898436 RepID=UPI0021513DE5|nr:HmuY family protein [Flavobacterium sp. J372]MCR5861113.1 hypothetical protein [Flavobacterium sp. J372]
MKKSFVLLFAFVAAVFTSCGDDDSNQAAGPSIGVSFANPSINITDAATPVQILFQNAVPQAGTVTVSTELTNVVYGTDFSTSPALTNNTIVVPFNAGATSAEFTFNKLLANIPTTAKNVKFTIVNTSFTANLTGNTTIQVNLNDTAVSGGAEQPATGGATAPNAVFVDLSTGNDVSALRTSWELRFYGGSDFRVGTNNSIKMSAKALETTNIDAPAQADESMFIAQGSGSLSQIDEPQGLVEGLLINVSANDADNKVYLVNLGNGPASTAPALGSDGSAGGEHRGWKKIRVLRSGNDYKLQYADIDATTHQEVIITKNAAYNFTFFSLVNNATAQVEPQKNQWDLAFTPFVNSFSMGGPAVPYYFADFIVTNTKGGARSYQVMTSAITYEAFTLADVDQSKFTNDQRNIGSNWRGTAGGVGGTVAQFTVRTDRFYVVKDPAGNIYKVKMTGGVAQNGERGFPTFQYTLLQ